MTWCECLWPILLWNLVALFLLWIESLISVVQILDLSSGIMLGSCLNVDEFWEMKECVFDSR